MDHILRAGMPCWLIATFLLFTATPLWSQSSVTGMVRNQDEALPGATVLLFTADSVLHKGAVTDEVGNYQFHGVPSGSYFLCASMIGFSKTCSQPLLIDRIHTVVPEIVLHEEATALNEVVVEGVKPLFEHQIDRLVVNVQNSITASGNTVLEVLQKSPGIVVNRQNNTITMNARSGVKIMINGKLVQLPTDVAVQMLDGMSAGNIEKIELIHAPPAEYDAEGNGGIIHIVTKSDDRIGTNGSLGITAGARWAETIGGNFSVYHRSEKFASFIDYSILRNHNLHSLEMERRIRANSFTQRISDYSDRENITIQQNLNAGLEMKTGTDGSVSLQFSGYRRNWDMNATATNIHMVTSDSVAGTSMKIYESNIWENAAWSLGVLQKISPKDEIRVHLDGLYYLNNNPSTYDIHSGYNERSQTGVSQRIDLDKDTPIRFLIGKADIIHNSSPALVWEGGLKAVTSTLDNDVIVKRSADRTWVVDSALTSYSTLKEQIGAGYLSAKWQPEKKWQLNSGIRIEYTHTSISTPSQKDLVNRRYVYLFPSLFLQRSIRSGEDIRFSYTRRITRPTYNDIAPFVFFWSPSTFSAGNTSLFPAIVESLTAGYHLRGWSTSVQFSHARKAISFFQPEIADLSNDLIYRSQNMAYLNTLALTNSYNTSVTRGWDMQCNLILQYEVSETTHLKKNMRLFNWGFNAYLMNMFTLGRQWSLEISGTYQSKSLYGVSQFLPVWALNAGIQKKFRDSGVLRIAIDDTFNTNNWRITTSSPENNMDAYFGYNWHNRYIRITYTFLLGNTRLRILKPGSASDEERGRIGN